MTRLKGKALALSAPSGTLPTQPCDCILRQEPFAGAWNLRIHRRCRAVLRATQLVPLIIGSAVARCGFSSARHKLAATTQSTAATPVSRLVRSRNANRIGSSGSSPR